MRPQTSAPILHPSGDGEESQQPLRLQEGPAEPNSPLPAPEAAGRGAAGELGRDGRRELALRQPPAAPPGPGSVGTFEFLGLRQQAGPFAPTSSRLPSEPREARTLRLTTENKSQSSIDSSRRSPRAKSRPPVVLFPRCYSLFEDAQTAAARLAAPESPTTRGDKRGVPAVCGGLSTPISLLPSPKGNPLPSDPLDPCPARLREAAPLCSALPEAPGLSLCPGADDPLPFLPFPAPLRPRLRPGSRRRPRSSAAGSGRGGRWAGGAAPCLFSFPPTPPTRPDL